MKVLAFSGGCFSGKTSAIEAFKHLLIGQGVEVHTGNELVRNNAKAVDIDKIRSNADKYLQFELDIINAKIEYEQSLQKRFSDNCIILLDRALTDSLMYYTLYINVNKLSDTSLDIYREFREKLSDAIYYSFANIYTHVIEFLPLDAPCYKAEDIEFRPSRVDTLKYVEHDVVQELNESYTDRVRRGTHNVSQLKYIRTKINITNGINSWLAKFLYNNKDLNFLP